MGKNKDFFLDLREGEEYYNVFMTKQTFQDIPKHLADSFYFNEIQQRETKELAENETFKLLVKRVRKAKKDLRDFKFDYFNK